MHTVVEYVILFFIFYLKWYFWELYFYVGSSTLSDNETSVKVCIVRPFELVGETSLIRSTVINLRHRKFLTKF
jgi:hypothetical protein